MPYQGLEVYLPSLEEVPGMLARLADASRISHAYAEHAFTMESWYASRVGLINQLTGSHQRIQDEVTSYFNDVRTFSDEQGGKIDRSARLYRATDEASAAALDQGLWSIEVQAVRDEAQELGRSTGLSLDRPEALRLEPEDPVDALRMLSDYRAEIPFEPVWAGEVSAVGKARDTIWEVTSWAANLGLLPRPYDVISELVIPFTGDWAKMKSCGDGLENLAAATGRMNTNAIWTVRRIDAVWQGNAADGAFVQLWRLHESLRAAPSILRGYSAAYHSVVVTIQDLERQAGEVLFELLDWAVIALALAAGGIPGVAALVLKGLPPSEFFRTLTQTVTRVYLLWDLISLATQAIWSHEARVEAGMLHGPGATAVMPTVPPPSDTH